MNDLASADANIQATMLEVISEGISAAILVYDKNDLIIFASQHVLSLLPIAKSFLAPGTRLRDFLGAVYDSGVRFSADINSGRRAASRDDWIAEQIAALWKEKTETVERRGPDRWISLVKRRLQSGHGVCVIKDISEHKKREEKWRADMERVQVTEEVLDNLPFTVTVKDQTHTFVAVNKATCRFHNLAPDAILGQKGEGFQPLELRERLEAINTHVLETGDVLQLPERLTRADGSESIIVANKYRIGKPGRYYVVTTMQDLTRFLTIKGGEEFTSPLGQEEFIELSLRREEHAGFPKGADRPDLAGGKVLVVSPDPRMEAESLARLGGLQLDASSVSSAEELTLFLQLASEADIRVDLVVLDTRLSPGCSEIAAAHGVPTLEIDMGEIEDVLVSAVTHRLTETGSDLTDMDVQDGWEVVEEGIDQTIDVLVAEDNEVNQIVFSQILEGLGYRYAIAADGEEVVQLWQDRAPRLILMDITLPKFNGFEAAGTIRAMEAEGARVPIIGVLAQAFDKDRDECFNSGMDDVILKPISPEALETIFHKFQITQPQRLTSNG